MKKILFASAVAACLFVSCKDEGAKKEKSEEVYRAIETGDVSKVKDMMAKDAIDHGGNPDGSDVVGADSILAMLSKIHTCFEPGLKINVISQAVDGDYEFTLTEMKGKTTANPGMGMPPSTEMNMRSVDLVKMKDGKMSEHWGYLSPSDMMKMMGPGAMPPPPPPMMKDTAKPAMPDTAKMK